MVRAGQENQLATELERKSGVAIGWPAVGNVEGLKSREDFKIALAKAYPGWDLKTRIPGDAGQLYRFAVEIQREHIVISYLKSTREYLVGSVDSDYLHDPRLFGNEYPHVRKVRWKSRVPRDSLSKSVRNSLGSTLTVFDITEHLQALTQEPRVRTEPASKPEDYVPYHLEVEEKAGELISDLFSKMDGYEFQHLVAAVLRSMGYRTLESAVGPDGTIDIRAGNDGLLLEEPRIRVQVKHRAAPASSEEIQQFESALGAHGRGLYVSTGGFSRDARKMADRAQRPISLWDEEEFIRNLTANYYKLEQEFRERVPLRQAWIPMEP